MKDTVKELVNKYAPIVITLWVILAIMIIIFMGFTLYQMVTYRPSI